MVVSRFQTLLCDTHESRDLHFKVRYKVFCEETGFENPEKFPDGREKDEYDDYATPFLFWDRLQQRCIGTMRLIDARKTALPSETISQVPLYELDHIRDRSVEFSRLAVLKDAQHADPSRSLRMAYSSALPGIESLPLYHSEEKNEALLRLLWASFEWGALNGVDYCYFIVTAPLARMLKRFGIPLTIVGTEVRHRGVRRPYRYNVYEAQEGMSRRLPRFAHLMKQTNSFLKYSEFRHQVSGRRDPTALAVA